VYCFTVKTFPTLDRDQRGCLYDGRLRHLVGELPRMRGAQIAAVEALAALRLAGHTLMLQTERWADRHGLSDGRVQLLFVLRRAPEHRMPLGEVADMLYVSPRNVTGLVDVLERDGLVERVPDPSDRRSVQARLTESGLAKTEELWEEGFKNRLRIVDGLSEEELIQLRHLCLRLVENAGRLASTAKEASP
jgi:DNA-binding MarR family transcriptional regulator